MNNLSSYCGLPDAKIGYSDKDLPVQLLYTGCFNAKRDLLCNDRRRKLIEFEETCLEKTREITSSTYLPAMLDSAGNCWRWISRACRIKSSFWDDSLILCWALKIRKLVFQCSFSKVEFLKNR